VDFRQRTLHCLLILGSIFYLRLCVLSLQGFRCALQPDPLQSTGSDAAATRSLILLEDGSTRCWTGEHLQTAAFALLLLVAYTGGLPLFCFVLLMRAFADERTGGAAGWMRARWSLLRDDRRTAAVAPDVGDTEPVAAKDDASAYDSVVAAAAAPLSRFHLRMHTRGMSGGWTFAASPAHKSSSVWSQNKYAPTSKQQHADSPRKAADDAVLVAEAEAAAERVRRRTFGYLYLGLRPSHFLFSLSAFAMHAWVAFVTVFAADDGAAALQLFLFGLMWAAHTLAVALQLPFDSWITNVGKVAIGLATLVSCMDAR
jgi:hypothetical protein